MGRKATYWCIKPIKDKHYADYKSVIFNGREEPRYKCKVCGKDYSSKDLGLIRKNSQYHPQRILPTIKQLVKKVQKC